MAFTKTSTITALAGNLVVDFQASATVSAHVTGNTSGSFYLVEVDNTANASSFAYLRIKDAQSAGSAGTLVPTWMFVAPPGTKTCYAFPDGQDYSTGLTFWCTTSTAKQDTTNPSSAVIVKLIAS
jgi:hypothetical protein